MAESGAGIEPPTEVGSSPFQLLKEHSKRSGVFVDFDGTLAEIVTDPRTARPFPGAIEAMDALADRFGVVGVISGRPLDFLRRHLVLSPKVRMCGLYGLQRLRNGAVVEDPAASQWRSVVDEGATTAEAQLPRGVRVERKGMSFVLHYRGAVEYAGAAEEWAAQFAERSGLDAQRGRLSIELGPFHDVDKGAMVVELGSGLRAACFIGDDAGDLSAFRALDRLADDEGAAVVKVAVTSAESPSALLAEADALVDGPAGVVRLLRELAGN